MAKICNMCHSIVDKVICDSEQFACKNANGANSSCIPASWECDKLTDCPDGDDEFNCTSITSIDFSNGKPITFTSWI